MPAGAAALDASVTPGADLTAIAEKLPDGSADRLLLKRPPWLAEALGVDKSSKGDAGAALVGLLDSFDMTRPPAEVAAAEFVPIVAATMRAERQAESGPASAELLEGLERAYALFDQDYVIIDAQRRPAGAVVAGGGRWPDSDRADPQAAAGR